MDEFFDSLLGMGNEGKKKKKGSQWGFGSDSFEKEYDGYYEELHSDALNGDLDAMDEMEDEFGDDWENEF